MKEQRHEQLDAIILLCGGVNKRKTKGGIKWRGNFETRAKVAAAAEVFHSQRREFGEAPDIISSGGAMWGAPPLGAIMKEHLINFPAQVKKCERRIPQEKIIEENDSTDSAEQVKRINGIAQMKGFNKLGVVADSVHGKQVTTLFRNYGLDAVLLPMETYLVQRNPMYEKIVNKLHSSLYWKWWEFKYKSLAKQIDKDPKLESSRAKFMEQVARFVRTKITWFRLPGTTR